MNERFLFIEVLISYILKIKTTDKDRKDFFQLCKNVYSENTFESQNIRELEMEYTSDKVFWWYTRDTFLSKVINAALQTGNIHRIFLFRGFISDILNQLKRYQVNYPIGVYRAQLVSHEELETLKQHCGELIAFNSFFHGTTDYPQVRALLHTSGIKANSERILFEVLADPKAVFMKPFADITKYSAYQDESIVLFMAGSIFRLKSIERSTDNNIWTVRMNLYNENESPTKKTVEFIRRQFVFADPNLQKLGKALCKLEKYDLAEQYFNRLLDELPPDDPLREQLFEDLVEIAPHTGKDRKSVDQRRRSSVAPKLNASISKLNTGPTYISNSKLPFFSK